MEINILHSTKDEIQVEIDSLTIAEILRVYANKDSAVIFAAWRREHPTKKPVLVVKTSGKDVKKVVREAIASITKDLDKFSNDFSKLN